MDADDIGTQLFSNLILAGWSVAQVEHVTTSGRFPSGVARAIQHWCCVFRRSDEVLAISPW